MILCLGLNPALQRILEFDSFTAGEVNRPKAAREVAAGKAVNVARCLKALGEDVLVTGFSGGARGRRVERLLDEEGIEHSFIRAAAETLRQSRGR